MTVVYEITDENEWRKTNPLRYTHNGLCAFRVSFFDACELLDKAKAERDEARKDLIKNLQTTGGMPWREWREECVKETLRADENLGRAEKAEAEVERLKVLICLEEASFGKATPLNVEEELRKIREMRAGLAPMNAKEIDAAKRVPLDQNTEIEQLNIAGATAVEAAKLFKQRAEKAESLYGHQKEELAALQDSVERLRTALQSCYWATNTYDGNYTRACDDVATIAINALKTQDK